MPLIGTSGEAFSDETGIDDEQFSPVTLLSAVALGAMHCVVSLNYRSGIEYSSAIEYCPRNLS